MLLRCEVWRAIVLHRLQQLCMKPAGDWKIYGISATKVPVWNVYIWWMTGLRISPTFPYLTAVFVPAALNCLRSQQPNLLKFLLSICLVYQVSAIILDQFMAFCPVIHGKNGQPIWPWSCCTKGKKTALQILACEAYLAAYLQKGPPLYPVPCFV